MPTDFEPSAEAALKLALENSRLMLLGETHGVEENPAVAYTLFRRFHFSAIALEWPSNADLKTPARSEDGRMTPCHFELLGQLEREGLLEQVILFDQVGDGTWSGRDLAMAGRLLAQRRSDLTTLVIAGNLHTQTRPSEHGHPMGEQVARHVPGVPTGRIRYLSGHYYNFGLKRFRSRWWNRRTRARFYRKNAEFIYEVPIAHAARAAVDA